MKEREIKPWDGAFTASVVKEAPEKGIAPTRTAAPKIEPYYSISEAAKLLNIPSKWIYAAITSGELSYYQMGKKARKVKLSAVTALIEKRQMQNDI